MLFMDFVSAKLHYTVPFQVYIFLTGTGNAQQTFSAVNSFTANLHYM